MATKPALADVAYWEYKINPAETIIDTDKTTAYVDSTLHEIRLQQIAPKTVSMWGDEYLDYIVLSPDGFKHFAYDDATGSMKEVASLGKNTMTNPITLFISNPYPDTVIFDNQNSKITHYSFTGLDIQENPAMAVSGVTNVVSIGTRDMDLAFLHDKNLEYYGFTGSGLSKVNPLSINSLTNPVDFALFGDNYDSVILDDFKVRYFNNGVENPAATITGIINPKSIAASEDGNIAVLDGNTLKHYKLSGASFVYNSALSITSGLANPSCVALRPGSQDRIIVDGNNIKYYMYDGVGLVYNASLSTTVAGLSNLFTYIPTAIVQSNRVAGLTRNVQQARVRAYCEVPDQTSIIWSLSADDGVTWTKRWRVVGTAGGSQLEITDDGTTWAAIGDKSLGYPNSSNTDITVSFDTPDRKVKWKAEMGTTNIFVTPKIRAPVPGIDTAVLLDVNTKPGTPTVTVPIVPAPDTCFTDARPTLSWTFIDTDDGDTQANYQIKITTLAGAKVVNTEEDGLPGDADPTLSQFKIPSEVLFNSGQSDFLFQVKVQDSGGLWSDDYSNLVQFCVVAFESPRVIEIKHPPSGQMQPDPNDPDTYIWINDGMVKDDLPKTKAGGLVSILVNGIGLDLGEINLKFPYLGLQSTCEEPTIKETVGNNKKFNAKFWTKPQLNVCPTGSVVYGEFTGTAGGDTTKLMLNENIPAKFADGVVVTEGTVLDDWMVVLQGRKE